MTAQPPSAEKFQAVDTSPRSRLSMIAQINDRLARSLDFGRAMKELISGATELLGVERGALMLLDHGTRTLSIQAAKGIDEETVRATRIQVGFGIAGAVAETGKPLIQKRQQESGAPASAERPDSGLCVPVAIHGKLLGVLGFEGRKSATRFDRSDIEFAQLAADQAAIALYCDLLHEEFQDELAEDETRSAAAGAPQLQRHRAAA